MKEADLCANLTVTQSLAGERVCRAGADAATPRGPHHRPVFSSRRLALMTRRLGTKEPPHARAVVSDGSIAITASAMMNRIFHRIDGVDDA